MLNDQGEQVTKFISYRLKESLVLQDSVPMNIINNKFTKPVEKCYLKFYLHDVIHKGKMIRLNGGDKISDVLKDKIVLEYPTIYVAANDECLQDRIIDSLQLAEEEEDDTTESSEDDSSDSRVMMMIVVVKPVVLETVQVKITILIRHRKRHL